MKVAQNINIYQLPKYEGIIIPIGILTNMILDNAQKKTLRTKDNKGSEVMTNLLIATKLNYRPPQPNQKK